MVLRCVVIEAIPKDRFGLFGRERGKFHATARGDEVDAVVAVPMLKAVLGSEIFFALVGALSEVKHKSR